jgi:hypothetical protein
MNAKHVSGISGAVSSLMVMSGLLVTGSLVKAQSDDEGNCSNRILRGDYGFAAEGQILAGPITGPLRAVGMTRFDGKGNLTRVEFATINGVALFAEWRPAVGTYVVNSDCTGSMEIMPGGGSPARKLRMVIVRNGKEIRAIEEANVISSIGIRRD